MSNKSQSVSVGGRIDALCDRFEAAWRANRSPRIEEYLSQVEQSHASYLLGELLFLELEYRQRRSDRPALEEYQSRFGQYDEVVAKVFTDFLGWSSARIRKLKRASSWSARTDSRMRRSGGSGDDAAAGDQEFAGDKLVPKVLGNYILLDAIGRGAMGVVYRALQRNIGRIVAVKLIRPDVMANLSGDQKQALIDRFRTETLAAARLDHDHIVTVYEVGEADGYYFYSMSYIEGESLADLCGDYPLDNRRAAELLAPVAHGVHEAHLHNILHRDLKPRNILVDYKTGRALVADFGLAKLQETGPHMTTTGDMIGSPAYMSPEQAMDSANVTAATDVYGLGATLYHLLTAKPPFQTAAVVMTISQVIFDEPVPPRRLNPAVDQDLETICLKCLEKDPLRRYASALALAEDLERYGRGEPIRARPLGPWGRFQRWCRRKPLVAGLAGLAALLLVSVIAVGSLGYVQTSKALQREASERVRAGRERDAARDAELRERQQRRLANQREDEARQNLQQARRAWDDFLKQVSEDPRLKVHGLEPLRAEFLELTCEFYEKIIQEKGRDADLGEGRARAYGRLAGLTAELGRTGEAIALYQEAQRTFQQLSQENPQSVEHLYQLTLTMNSLGALFSDIGRLPDAEHVLQDAYANCERLVRLDPNDPRFCANLAMNNHGAAVLHSKMGLREAATWDWQAAIANWMSALRGDAANERYLDGLAKSHNGLALLYGSSSRYPEARTEALAALKIWEELVRHDRRIPEYRQALASCRANLGQLHVRLDQRDEAETEYCASLAIRAELAAEHPDVPAYAAGLAVSHISLGGIYEVTGRTGEAEAAYRAAVRIGEKLVGANGDVTEHRVNLAVSQEKLGLLLVAAHRPQDAEPLFRQAEVNFEQLASSNLEVPSYRGQLAEVCVNLAELLRKEQRFAEAQASLKSAEFVRQQLVQQYPNESAHAQALAEVRAKLGQISLVMADYRSGRGDYESALRAYGQAIATLEPLVDSPADQQLVHQWLTAALVGRSQTHERSKKYREAVASWDQAIEFETGASRDFLCLRRAIALARLGDHVNAVREAARLIEPADVPPAHLYQAARAYACAAGAVPQDRTLSRQAMTRLHGQYAAQAMDALTRARRQGYFDPPANAETLPQDDDLAPLRQRDDFQELVREVRPARTDVKHADPPPDPPADRPEPTGAPRPNVS